ncbi:MAG: NUDIX hydrolase [Caldilineae bacterium]|nr:MAG: NUDIX hydrolase [Caldilineae bacterium]
MPKLTSWLVGSLLSTLLNNFAAPMAAVWEWVPEWVQWRLMWLLNTKVTIGVGGVLRNDQGEILLLRHRFHHRVPWGLPGGWLQAGETIFECWQREVFEETGLFVEIDGLVLHKAKFRGLEFFLSGRVAGGALHLDENEILEARFFAPERLPVLQRDHHRAIRRALAQDGFWRTRTRQFPHPLNHEVSDTLHG